jgi:hypothetical protein
MEEEELRRAVTAAGALIDWPAPPDLAAAVSRAIALRGGAPPSYSGYRLPGSGRRRALVLAVVAVILLAAVAGAAKLVIDLGAVSLEVVPGRPTALPGTPANAGAFGEPVTLDEAAAIVGFTPLVPEALGEPDRVWAERRPSASGASIGSARVVLAWRPTAQLPRIPGTPWGAVLMEFAGDVNSAAKRLYAETGSLRRVAVDGQTAFWTTSPHELDLLGPDGMESYLVTGNVLLWNEPPLTLRLETTVGVRAAIEIAGSIAP